MYPSILPTPGEQLDAMHVSRERGVINPAGIEQGCVSKITGGLIVLRLQIVLVEIFLHLCEGRVRRSFVDLASRRGRRLRHAGRDDNTDEEDGDCEGSGVPAAENRAESVNIHRPSPVKGGCEFGT